MSDQQQQLPSLQTLLAQVAMRRRLTRAAAWGLKGLFYGAVLAIGLLIVQFLAGESADSGVPWVTLWVVPAVGASALVAGFLWRVDRFQLARAIDSAAGSEDRLASVLQLQNHSRKQRVNLLMHDALDKVAKTSSRAAIPWSVPRELKWLPIAGLALVGLLWWGGGTQVAAHVETPDVTAEQWADLESEFRRQLEEFPEPQSPEDRELAERLDQMARKLSEHPDKKHALSEIAKLRAELQSRRAKLKSKNVSMRKASRAIQKGGTLQQFAAQLRKGDYEKAAKELEELAKKLKAGKLKLSAEEYKALASDLERLMKQLAQHEELSKACQQCASAAATMNRENLADALRRLSKTIRDNSNDMQQCDRLNHANDMLSDLERQLGKQKQSCPHCKGTGQKQCSSCGGKHHANCQSCSGTGKTVCPHCSGNRSNSFVKRGNKKGGLKAGWGTAENWLGGKLNKDDERRLPSVVNAKENQGASTSHSVISTAEEANSALSYRELYADMVQKSEADLDLEGVPVAYREFLKRYFVSIRPQEDAPPDDEPK